MTNFQIGDIITGVDGNPGKYSLTTNETTMEVVEIRDDDIRVAMLDSKTQKQIKGNRYYVKPEHFRKVGNKKTMTNKPVYWECKDNGHSKFWASQIVKKGNIFILVRKWGRIGNNPQTMEQEFNTYSKAENILDDLIQEKERKGYKSIF